MRVEILALIMLILSSSATLVSAQDSSINILIRDQPGFFVVNTLTEDKQPLGISDWLQTFEAHDLAISPNGTKLAFISVTLEPSSAYYSRVNILDLNTGDIQIVPTQSLSEEAIEPVWSPDGRYVAYLIGGGGLPGTAMGIFDTQTGADQRYPFGGENLRWSPDGQYLLAGVRSYIDEEIGWKNNIWVFDINDSDIFGITGDDLNVLHAEWLPDSSGIIGVCGISDEINAFCQVAIWERPAQEAIILHQFNPGEYIDDFQLIGDRIVFEYLFDKPAAVMDLTTGQITPLEAVGRSQFLDVLTPEQVAILTNPPFLSQLSTCDATIPAADVPALISAIASANNEGKRQSLQITECRASDQRMVYPYGD